MIDKFNRRQSIMKNENASISRFLASFIWKRDTKGTMIIMVVVTNDKLRCNIKKV